MFPISKNNKTVLSLAYKHYLETNERTYTLIMKNSEMASLLNALISLSEEKYINIISGDVYSSTISLKYVYELTDIGIKICKQLKL